MAKKKEKEEKVEVKDTAFDWETALESMDDEPLKAGFIYYIVNNNITIKSENDLTKFLKKFKELSAEA